MRTALADGFANRASFLLQLAFMVVNDLTWVVFWGLFFHRTGEIRGWQVNDVFLLFAIICTSVGLVAGVFANSRRIGRLASEGALDETLVLPVGVLGHVITTRIDAANVGDCVFGVALFIVTGQPTLERTAVFIGAVIAAATVFLGFLIICGSLTFFVGGRGEHGELGFNAVTLFAMYPADLFGGLTKLLLFTAIPAGFVSTLPASLVRQFELGPAALLVAVAVLFAVVARVVFALGLRRYSSGSVWVR